MTSSPLHSAALALGLISCLSAFFTVVMIAYWQTRGETKELPPLKAKSSTSAVISAWNRARTSITRNPPVYFLVWCMLLNAGAYCTSLWYELHPEGQDWMYNVRIVERLNDYNFRMDVADARGVRHQFAVTFCPDYRPTTEMQKGVTLEYLTYGRDIMLHCFEVGKPQYGYKLRRGENNVPIVTQAGQTAAQGQAEATGPAAYAAVP